MKPPDLRTFSIFCFIYFSFSDTATHNGATARVTKQKECTRLQVINAVQNIKMQGIYMKAGYGEHSIVFENFVRGKHEVVSGRLFHCSIASPRKKLFKWFIARAK